MSQALVVARHVADVVASSAVELNRLDAQAGDGDLGVTMRTAAAIVIELLPSLEGMTPAAALRTCGLALARGAPSTAGTLVASALLRAAKSADTIESGTPAAVAAAALLESATAGIRERGKAELGSKTMLDALAPAAVAAGAAANEGAALDVVLDRAAAAADLGAQETRTMRAVHGRAGWLADRSDGHIDAGARLVAIALRAAAEATTSTTAPGDSGAGGHSPL